jgi:DNA primase
MEDACRFFETTFTENKNAREYLQARGLEPETMRTFRIGFAPDDWQQLYEHLKKKGYSDTEMDRSGLIKRSAEHGSKSSYYDRFRSRIMFPIQDSAGRVVAFSGRIFGEAAKDEKNAKYLNSPETELFNKGRILYGYDKAKQYIRKYDFSILVEGQMDIVMSHQANYQNTVAVSGTGLTEYHLDLLHRLSPKVVLAFDADAAGIASNGRAASLALKRGMEVKVATIPTGKDPADCIAEDANLWKKAVREARHVVDFYIGIVEKERDEKEYDERRFALRIRDTVLPYIARMQSGVDQAHFVKKVSVLLGLGEDAVWQDVRTHARAIAREESHEPHHETQPQTSEPERKKEYSRREEFERELVGFLLWQNGGGGTLSEDDVQRKATEFDVTLEGILARYSDEHAVLAMRSEVLHADAKDPSELLERMLRAIARESLQEERKELTRGLRTAEGRRESDVAERLLARFTEVSRRIEELDRKG